MKRTLGILLALTLMLGLGAARAQQNLTDMTGREVYLAAPARRVVILAPADVEILYALDAGSLLVGRGEYANYPESALEVPSVQSGMETNLEQIISLEPDLVVMSKMAQTREQVEKLEEAGIPVAVTDAQSIEGTYEAIRLIGTLAGRAEEAEALIGDMKGRFEALSEKTKDFAGGSVYFEVSPLQWGLWTAGKGTFMQEIAQLLGLKNVFEEIEGWGEISQEQVLERDPDYIVTTAMYFGEGPTPAEEIMSREGWDGLKAVKNQAVLQLDSDQVTRPGPRLADAAEMLYSLIWGEAQEAVPAA